MFDTFLQTLEPQAIADKAQARRMAYMQPDVASYLKLPAKVQPLCYVRDQELMKLPIQDCGEAIVHLQSLAREKSSQIVFAAGSTAYGAQETEMYLREGAASLLFLAEEYLKQLDPNVTFKVTDTLRPIALQRKYFEEIKKNLHDTEGLEGEELYDRVTQVIADPDLCPPHTTGAAIDLTLVSKSSQQELDMHTKIDEVDDERIYTFHPEISSTAKQNRILLYTALTEAGFVNSPVEWWHYSYGDQQWALVTGQECAIYDIYTSGR